MTQTQVYVEETRDEALQNFFFFTRAIIGMDKLTDRFHKDMCDELQYVDALRRLWLVSRDHFKSTIVGISYPLWLLIRNPEERILLAADTANNAEQKLAKIKQLILGSRGIRAFFPEIIPGNVRKTVWSDSEIVLPRQEAHAEPSISTIGAGGAVVGQHYTRIICLAPDTEIYTSQGLVAAKNLRPGLRVLTHQGRFQSILDVSERPMEGVLVGIHSWLAPEPVWVTEEHPILVQRDDEHGLPSVLFVPAGEVTEHDILVMARLRGGVGSKRLLGNCQEDMNALLREIETWWILGLWVAEGCAGGRTRFALGNTEDWIVERIQRYCDEVLAVPCGVTEVPGGYQVAFTNPVFQRLIALFGTHAYNKIVPGFVLQSAQEKISAFLDGYYTGDGYIEQKGRQTATSVSKSLLVGIALLEQRRGNSAGVRKGADGGSKVVAGNLCETRDSFTVSVSRPQWSGSKPNRAWCDRRFWYHGIKKIERRPYDGVVFNCRVDGDSTMTSLWLAHHNCDDIIAKEATDSPSVMSSVIRWADSLESLLVEPYVHTIDIVGTRKAHDDVYEHLRSHWKTGEDLEDRPFYREFIRSFWASPGEPLFPELYGGKKNALDFARRQQRQNAYLWSCDFENDPRSPEAEFRIEDLQSYQWDVSKEHVLFEEKDQTRVIGLATMTVYMTVDPAYAKERGSSMGAIIVSGCISSGEIFILEAIKDRWGGQGLIKAVKRTSRKYQAYLKVVGVEATGTQQAWIDDLQKEMRTDGLHVRIESLQPGGKAGKDARIRFQLQKYIGAKRVYLTAEMNQLQRELRHFPLSKEKDLLDAAAYSAEHYWNRAVPVDHEGKDRERELVAAREATRNPRTGY